MKKIKIITLLLLSSLLITCKKEDMPVDGKYVASIADVEFLPIVKGTVNGKAAYFILDSGASVSILDYNQLSDYNIKSVGVSDVGVVGYGGSDFKSYDIDNPTIFMGNERMGQDFNARDIKTIVNTVSKNSKYKIIGIIGNNNISSSKLILDFKNNKITK